MVGIVPVGGLTPHDAALGVQTKLAQGLPGSSAGHGDGHGIFEAALHGPGRGAKAGLVRHARSAKGNRAASDRDICRLHPDRPLQWRHSHAQIGGGQKTVELNARRMASGNVESAFIVMPGDVMTIAENRF